MLIELFCFLGSSDATRSPSQEPTMRKSVVPTFTAWTNHLNDAKLDEPKRTFRFASTQSGDEAIFSRSNSSSSRGLMR